MVPAGLLAARRRRQTSRPLHPPRPARRRFRIHHLGLQLVYIGLIPGRDDDVLGIALGYADLTNGAAQTAFDEVAQRRLRNRNRSYLQRSDH